MTDFGQVFDLNTSEKLIFSGNVLLCLGTLAISLGTLLRAAASNELPTNKPNEPQTPRSTNVSTARTYFEL